MGTAFESSQLRFLRELAARQGVEPSDDDLAAVLGFLETILPELARLEEELDPEEGG
jgi:hypothetical protein